MSDQFGWWYGNVPLELSYIIDPIIERDKAILDDVRGMFKTVGFKESD
ncbi:hypothetical protein [Methylomonas fluvii]|uniref:Uncharacterized protein n=1 Tax=Methylomonas fluvii TaxID=1854564 RepID=A0ABR9DGD3_9GAMM|nr:hypothetical protein [Methylomonas fluvii]MBD9361314.1 hypothetical protein [Methylomonas fluvii]